MVSYEAEAAALTFLAQAAAAEEESMRDAIYKEPTANRSGESRAQTRWQQLVSPQQGSLRHKGQASLPGQLASEPSCLAQTGH